MNTKKSSFEPSIILLILLGVFIVALSVFGTYTYTDSSLKAENASLRAGMLGGQAAKEEQKALERREEEVTRRENNTDQRDKDYYKKVSEFNSTVRLSGKAEGKAEQLSENNEVLKQSFDGVVWQRNILWVVVIILVLGSFAGGCIMFLYIRKLQYSINDRDRAIEVIRVQIYNPSGTIEQIKTAFETSTQFIESEQISNQKLLKSSIKSE